MKTLTSLALSITLLLSSGFTQAQNSSQALYNQGLALFNQGRYAEALVVFESVLKAQPNYVYARSYAAKCKTAIAQNLSPKKDLEGQLASVILPELSFADAPIGDVLDYLDARTQEISKGQTVVNFIYKGTPEQRSGTLLTLSVRNIPLTGAIKYVGELSRSQVKYEEHAVVIDPAPASAPATAETNTALPGFVAPGSSSPAPATSKSTFP